MSFSSQFEVCVKITTWRFYSHFDLSFWIFHYQRHPFFTTLSLRELGKKYQKTRKIKSWARRGEKWIQCIRFIFHSLLRTSSIEYDTKKLHTTMHYLYPTLPSTIFQTNTLTTVGKPNLIPRTRILIATPKHTRTGLCRTEILYACALLNDSGACYAQKNRPETLRPGQFCHIS